jgi:hypothetical protein
MRRGIASILLLAATVAPAFAATQAEFDITPLPLLSEPYLSFTENNDWQAASSNPGDYSIGFTRTDGMAEAEAAVIVARPGALKETNGVLTRYFDATPFRGQRLRLSARLKSRDAGRLQMWLRIKVTGTGGQAPTRGMQFYNMADRPITGTTTWKRYEIVLDVPEDASELDYGFGLTGGKGAAFGDSFRLEAVGTEVAVSSQPAISLASRPSSGWNGNPCCTVTDGGGLPEMNGHVLPGTREDPALAREAISQANKAH